MWGADKAFKGNKTFAASIMRNYCTGKRKNEAKARIQEVCKTWILRARHSHWLLQESICHFSDKLLLIKLKFTACSLQSRSSDAKLDRS